MQILSIGEVLWDVFEQQELLGTDRRGTAALEAMRSLGLTTEFVQLSSRYSTGAAIVVTDSNGNASYRIDRPAAFDDLQIDEALLAKLDSIMPDWIYFGTLSPFHKPTEESLLRIVGRIPNVKRFYDLNLRDGHWDLQLVERLSSMATILKLNDAEAEILFGLTLGSIPYSLEDFCSHWSTLYGIQTIVVTLGGEGCAVFSADTLTTYRGFDVQVIDTVGAGDAFSAAFLHGFHLGWPLDRTARFANALGATVASRAGATPAWTLDDCLKLNASVTS
jgi:fructokinase